MDEKNNFAENIDPTETSNYGTINWKNNTFAKICGLIIIAIIIAHRMFLMAFSDPLEGMMGIFMIAIFGIPFALILPAYLISRFFKRKELDKGDILISRIILGLIFLSSLITLLVDAPRW
ncbi:MAG: hypothetical protein WAV73_05035 [Candidatus Moraniibacteriota bacterium]